MTFHSPAKEAPLPLSIRGSSDAGGVTNASSAVQRARADASSARPRSSARGVRETLGHAALDADQGWWPGFGFEIDADDQRTPAVTIAGRQ